MSGLRPQVKSSGPSSQVSDHGSQVTGHKQREMSFFEIKKMLALVHTVDELELTLFNFVVDS